MSRRCSASSTSAMLSSRWLIFWSSSHKANLAWSPRSLRNFSSSDADVAAIEAAEILEVHDDLADLVDAVHRVLQQSPELADDFVFGEAIREGRCGGKLLGNLFVGGFSTGGGLGQRQKASLNRRHGNRALFKLARILGVAKALDSLRNGRAARPGKNRKHEPRTKRPMDWNLPPLIPGGNERRISPAWRRPAGCRDRQRGLRYSD